MTEEVKRTAANVRSFRVTDDVMARFKDIQDEMGLTHDGALKMLVDAYELDQAKNAIPDRETEISNFQMKANELVEAFIYSLQLNQDAEARIRAEIALQMQSKDEAIANYQEQLKTAQNSLNELLGLEQQLLDTQIAKAGVEREFAAFKEAQELLVKQHEKQLSDKDSIVSMLTDKLSTAERKAAGFDELQKGRDELLAELQEERQRSKDAQNALNEKIKDLQHKHELDLERALRAAEKGREEAVREIKDKCSEEIQKAQNALLAATKESQKTEREQTQEIRSLEHQLATAQQELALLKNNKI